MQTYGPRTIALLWVGLVTSACASPIVGKRLPSTAQAPRAFDQHRFIEILPAATAAILDGSYYSANIEYLLEGDERALLLDSGSGPREIAPVIHSLTDLPVTVTPSHLHYDHVRGLNEFSDIALIDAEDLRKRTINGTFTPTATEHLGWFEKEPLKPFRVTRWLQPGEKLDLGNREIEVLLTPGHTKTSVMLYDAAMPALFTGDFLYPGGLLVESLQEYRQTLTTLLARMPKNVTIYPAHNGRGRKITTLAYSDLSDLHTAVCGALDGTVKGKPANAFGGIPSMAYPVNKRLNMFVLKWPRSPSELQSKQ